MTNRQPRDIADQLRQDGYHDGADCIEFLLRIAVEAIARNIELTQGFDIRNDENLPAFLRRREH